MKIAVFTFNERTSQAKVVTATLETNGVLVNVEFDGQRIAIREIELRNLLQLRDGQEAMDDDRR
jgi:hypothetical protein